MSTVRLSQAIHADQAIGDLVVDVFDGLEHAFAHDRPILSPSRSSHASWTPVLAPLGTAARPHDPSTQRDFHFDGRVAAAIQNLSAVNGRNNAHRLVPVWQCVCEDPTRPGLELTSGGLE